MTDRIRTITVILNADYRDDAQSILDAIRMIKGVEYVEPTVVSGNDVMNRAIVALEMRNKILDAVDKAMPIFPK